MLRSISSKAHQLAWTGISYSRILGLLPESYDSATLKEDPTPIYDINGELLLYRAPFVNADGACGYADIGANPALGDLLLAVAAGATWKLDEIETAARSAARDRYDLCDECLDVRIVAFSYPKLAAQFLRDGNESAMLELFTWEPVPDTNTGGQSQDVDYGFERWSMLDNMTTGAVRERSDAYRKQKERWERAFGSVAANAATDPILPALIAPALELPKVELAPLKLFNTRELHYSSRDSDHSVCYELRGQLTSVWCVAASVQMFLDFYRYQYSQVRIAKELDLGTLSDPNGLPYSQDVKVVTVLEQLTKMALDAQMNASPNWSEFKAEIDGNRPLISFVPGHSRTVAGYYEAFLAPVGESPFRGLLVYDPWPPTTGVITRWENFNTHSYRRSFTAKLRLA